MRLINYRRDEHWNVGVERDGYVVNASLVVTASSNDSLTMRSLLEHGPQTVEEVFKRSVHLFDAGYDGIMALSSLELGPPVPDPDKIVCLGLNYRDHATEAELPVPEVPVLFAKFRNALIGPQSPIALPRISEAIDYEGELAVIIGRRCKDISAAHALEYVAGYAAFNDISARDLQIQTSQWMAGKALDTFAPMGPGIVPASEISNPQDLWLSTWVNGERVQYAHTSEMIFSVAEAIAYISSLMTLEPGDIIATGTPSGIGAKRTPPLFLKAGDIVEVEIESIGRLRNTVIAPPQTES